MLIKSASLNETDKLAQVFARKVVKTGAFVCLYGEIGSGKTTFIKSLAGYLGVKENVTSPSFVILNEYHSGGIPIYHFDLYRLESEGVKSIADELEQYCEGKILTLVEWAQFSNTELPFEKIEIKINYTGETSRTFEFKGFGEHNKKIVKELEDEYSDF